MSRITCRLVLLAALSLLLAPSVATAQEKTLSFEKPLFLEDKGTGKVKHIFRLAGVSEDWDASVAVTFAGSKDDAGTERDRWLALFKDKSGASLDAAAAKPELFEVGTVKGTITTVTGTIEERATKAVVVALEGPDGIWLLRLQGGAKTVDRHREDFLRFARSARAVDKSDKSEKSDKPTRKSLEAAIEKDASDWRSRVALAKLLLDEQPGAVDVTPLVERAAELAPDEAEVRALQGELHYLANRPDEAYKALSDAVRADLKNGRARKLRAYISIERRNKNIPFPPEFQDDLEQGLNAFPNDLRLHDARARERYFRQKWREALVDFDVILTPEARKQAASQNLVADLLRARAFCLIKTKDYEKALRDCKDAIEIEPKSGVAHRFLGVVELEHGDPKSAIEAFDRAAKLLKGEDQNDAIVLRAQAKEAAGDLDAAIEDLEAFLEESPGSRFAKRATDSIARIRAAIEKKKQDKKKKDEEDE